MINKSMNSNKVENNEKLKAVNLEKKPDEKGGVYVSSHLKIFDPNTKEILVQQRAD